MIRRYLQASVRGSLQALPCRASHRRKAGWEIDARSGPHRENWRRAISRWMIAWYWMERSEIRWSDQRDTHTVVLDEVQKAPDLLRAIKRRVDRDKAPGQYLLTGSANLMTFGVGFGDPGRPGGSAHPDALWLARTHRKTRPRDSERPFRGPNLLGLAEKLPKTTGRDNRKEIISTILSGGYPEPALMKHQRFGTAGLIHTARLTWKEIF